jgi:CRISPR/Cas system-associated exonuclease Cas4 (RecB family)
VDFKNEFSWSQSRKRFFDDCKRKYFFQYYGSFGGWDYSADQRKKELWIEKSLQTVPMFLGDSVHRVIEAYLNEVRKGRDVPLNTLVRQFHGYMEHGLEESKSGKHRLNPKKYCGLLEHEYGEVSESDWKNALFNGELCLKNFYKSEVLKEIKESDKNSWLPIEDFQSFDFNGVNVFVKIDFAMQDGQTVIYDWKTGKTESDDNVQLACYALYASKKWKAEFPIVTREYNLYLDKLREVVVQESDNCFAESVIRESVAEMKSLLFKPESNLAREDDFPRNEGDWCTYCKFRKVCLEKP